MTTGKFMEKVPKTIKEHPEAWLWSRVWYKVHHQNKMFTAVFCGERGAGKSWSMGYLSELLDRDINDVCRFTVERTCYSPTQFTEWLAKDDLPIGTVINLDDAGITLYSKESLKKVAIQLGKVFQSMRYKNYVILLSLPYFKMLESHVRKLSDFYIEIVGRDLASRENLAKIQQLQGEYFTGEVYRHNLIKNAELNHSKFDVDFPSLQRDFFRFKKPSVKWQHAYEKFKLEYLDYWYKHTHRELEALEQKQVRALKKIESLTMNDALKIIREKWKKCVDSKTGKLTGALVLNGLKTEDGEIPVGQTTGMLVARILNKELGLV